jgi:hypothetical protein
MTAQFMAMLSIKIELNMMKSMTSKNVFIEGFSRVLKSSQEFSRVLKSSQEFSSRRNRNRNEMTSLFILFINREIFAFINLRGLSNLRGFYLVPKILSVHPENQFSCHFRQWDKQNSFRMNTVISYNSLKRRVFY